MHSLRSKHTPVRAGTARGREIGRAPILSGYGCRPSAAAVAARAPGRTMLRPQQSVQAGKELSSARGSAGGPRRAVSRMEYDRARRRSVRWSHTSLNVTQSAYDRATAPQYSPFSMIESAPPLARAPSLPFPTPPFLPRREP
ncbi:hypothetical protein [Lysobacter gummosus]|uniref:hypothetical protein n=1 Tax=Lysobacter gummosus TaxID=262324 RepID=UPI0036337896